MIMKVEKTQFENAIRALLNTPPMPLKALKGKGRPKKARPQTQDPAPQKPKEQG